MGDPTLDCSGSRGSPKENADQERMKMAEYLQSIRESEAKEEEEFYWRTHAWQRWKRDAYRFSARISGARKEQKDEDEDI